MGGTPKPLEKHARVSPWASGRLIRRVWALVCGLKHPKLTKQITRTHQSIPNKYHRPGI